MATFTPKVELVAAKCVVQWCPLMLSLLLAGLVPYRVTRNLPELKMVPARGGFKFTHSRQLTLDSLASSHTNTLESASIL